MPRFKLTRVYTPTNPLKQRETYEHEFFCENNSPYAVAKAGAGFYEAQMQQVRLQVNLDTAYPIEFTIIDSVHNYWFKIERLPDRNETLATDENIIKWAEAQVQATPTIEVSEWDDIKNCYVPIVKPNTVENELTEVLLSNDSSILQGEKARDLVELLLTIYKDGHKGYKTLTREELLDSIRDQILDPSDCECLEDIEAFSTEDDE